MRSSIAGAVAVILCIGGCHRASQKRPVTPAPAPVVLPPRAPDSSAVPPRLWVFSGGETEPFCLLLREDRSGVFYNGFLYLNPVRWRYDSLAHRLDLVLSHLSSADYFALRDNLARGDLLGLDTASGRVSYSLNPAAPAINFFNWVLVPPKYLEDWQLASARKGCPALGTPGGA
jgi:hypothetical protein